MEGFYFAGTRVNPENIRTIPRDRFIARFMPQTVFFSEIPNDKREEELGVLWDMCQEENEAEKEIIPESHKKAAKKAKNDSKGTIPPLDADVSQQDGNNGGS